MWKPENYSENQISLQMTLSYIKIFRKSYIFCILSSLYETCHHGCKLRFLFKHYEDSLIIFLLSSYETCHHGCEIRFLFKHYEYSLIIFLLSLYETCHHGWGSVWIGGKAATAPPPVPMCVKVNAFKLTPTHQNWWRRNSFPKTILLGDSWVTLWLEASIQVKCSLILEEFVYQSLAPYAKHMLIRNVAFST